jgi:segregation and condensation protein A
VPAPPLSFHLPQYEGPLDLLLDLIRKQQVNIWDIPISHITAQYMEYMQRAVELDIELSSEFVYMAATLIHIKSRMLLPRDPELEKISPEEDPRQELVLRLLEHERFKSAAEMLQQKRLLEEATWSHPSIREFLDDEPRALAVNVFDLVRTFELVLDRARSRPVFEVGKDDVTVPEMMLYVQQRLKMLRSSEAMPAMQLFEEQRSERAMICLFLAILELVKRRGVELIQMEAFGDIGLSRGPFFEEALQDNQELAAVEGEYN